MALQPKITHLADVQEEHFQRLAFLWMQRQGAVRDADYLPNDLADLDRRIAAHIRGFLINAEQGIPYLASRLAEEDLLEIQAAALLLVRIDTEASWECLTSPLLELKGPPLQSLVVGIIQGIDSSTHAKGLQQIYEQLSAEGKKKDPLLDVLFFAIAQAGFRVAAEAQPSATSPSIPTELFNHEDASIRQMMWMAAGMDPNHRGWSQACV